MSAVEVSHVSKAFAGRTVVDDVSFEVRGGEILGLIGPNGAGKTTTIRMILDIIKPDSGEIRVLGAKLDEAAKDRIGYLPEERGLYLNLTVLDSLVYLATLKGMERRHATKRAEELLARVDMLSHRHKKIKELSRGMGQFVQFLVTIMHRPQLIVLDEPFANLDPINTELIKEMVLELRSEGRALVLSTHRMNEVEALCDRIFMINEGRGVLYGDLAGIKMRYRENSIILDYEGELGELPGVVRRHGRDGHSELVLDGQTPPQQVLARLLERGVTVNRFEVATPPLQDIFLKVVGERQ